MAKLIATKIYAAIMLRGEISHGEIPRSEISNNELSHGTWNFPWYKKNNLDIFFYFKS